MARASLALLMLVLVGCGSDAKPIPPPDGPAAGSLLVLETQPCNWLRPPDPGKCDAVGLARIGLNGQPSEELTPELPMGMRSMALSPDRTALAWPWNWELAVMNVDGSGARVITEKMGPETSGETIFDPTWSPDGSEILYRWSGFNAETTWYRISVQTGALREVDMPVDCSAMAWAPDGNDVACEVWIGDIDTGVGETDLYVVDLESLVATPLTQSGDGSSAHRPDWSPDGRRLAFSGLSADNGAADADVNGIWVMDVESGEAIRVADGTLSVPSWSPDGGHLVAYDDAAGRLITVARDGSGLVAIDHEPRRFVAPRWLPSE